MRRSIGEYPPEWVSGELQKRAKTRANHECEQCGLQYPEDSNLSLETRLLGSCHHIDHNRSNSDPDNIVFLCNVCHLEAHRWSWIPGGELPRAWRYNIPRWIVARNLPYTTKQKTFDFIEVSE